MIVYLDSVNKIQRQFLEHELITVRRKRTLYDSSVKTYFGSDLSQTKLSLNGPIVWANTIGIIMVSEQCLIKTELTATWMHRITFKLK